MALRAGLEASPSATKRTIQMAPAASRPLKVQRKAITIAAAATRAARLGDSRAACYLNRPRAKSTALRSAPTTAMISVPEIEDRVNVGMGHRIETITANHVDPNTMAQLEMRSSRRRR
jgi:hypothetical protein